MNARLLAIFPLLMLGVLAFTACGDDDDPGSTSTSTSAPPTTADSTRPASSPPGPSSATVQNVRMYPLGTQTGIVQIDSFLKAVSSQDIQALQALLEYSSVPCSTATDDIFPACPPSASEGTPVDASFWGRCDAGWTPRDVDLVPGLQRYVATSLAVYAVAKLPAPARTIEQAGRPAGKYFVVMDDERASSGEPRGAVLTETGRIVSMYTGCFSVTPREFLAGHYSVYTVGGTTIDYLVAPLP